MGMESMLVSAISNFFELALAGALLVGLTPLLGRYIASVCTGNRTCLHPAIYWIENLTFRLAHIDPHEEMSWWEYTKSLFYFNALGFITLFLILIFQDKLPLNPQAFPPVPGLLAFNISASFVTNTNWQAYAGETTLSYFSQMLGLTAQNFLSPACGIATLMALIRGLTRREMHTIGNFWADVVRTILYILIPLSILFSLIFISEGAVQNLNAYLNISTLENYSQTIPMGPAASQTAISLLGSNGGGFFNVVNIHPFVNPSALTNFLQVILIFLIPSALIYAYAQMINCNRHAYLLYGVMATIFFLGFIIALWSESIENPIFATTPNLEGKEVRFGVMRSVLWSTATTATSDGSINSQLSSLSPLAGGVALFNIILGECIFGGVGTGLCSMLMFVLMTVFFSALMVGRTPEYLGKKIEIQEMQWVVMAVLMPSALTLIGSGITFLLPGDLGNINVGPHGLTEIIYSYASASANNGSAFANYLGSSETLNFLLGCVMIAGRTAILLPSLAIAGLLVKKNITPPSLGTFSTSSFIFALLLTNIILTIAGLTFFPALSLGPVAEQILMRQGHTF